ncbi:MAG: hypothetical protein B7Z69_10200 [Actinobacteria bacterium 21-73-9]|nr:MAG: hypothetical protein B7Z69_10200 [Actinobacteria bacterium 21-73-9]
MSTRWGAVVGDGSDGVVVAGGAVLGDMVGGVVAGGVDGETVAGGTMVGDVAGRLVGGAGVQAGPATDGAGRRRVQPGSIQCGSVSVTPPG